METTAVVINREEAIEVIKNNEQFKKAISGLSNSAYNYSIFGARKNKKIVESIDYSNNEIKIHLNRKEWDYHYKAIKRLLDDIISDNGLEDYVDIYMNKEDCWIKVM